MFEIINSEIQLAKQKIKELFKTDITDDRAFSHVLLKYIFEVDYIDQMDSVTDGSNDGGIDFIYYDEEESKVILGQSKYTNSLTFDQIVTELEKMSRTVKNFKRSNTGSYSEKLKKCLQNAIDQLPEDNTDNFEFDVFTTAPVDADNILDKIKTSGVDVPYDSIAIWSTDDIEKKIEQVHSRINTVDKSEVIQLDQTDNYLRYESDDSRGVMCNISSKSLIRLYNKYAGNGLFDLNIRKYIRNKLVDDGIKRTLKTDSSNFWFLNNGIIIACREFNIDKDTVTVKDFSIVNGGQTTTLIGSFKKSLQEFYIPCKIVAAKNENNAPDFFTKIAEATNSQKPIYPRDLKSNTPEMIRLAGWLRDEGIYLEIKRGYKPPKKYEYSIKNDELGQIVLAFAFQRPGTARSGKKVIFQNQNIYDKLFKTEYEKDSNKKQFIIDLIKLNDKYSAVEDELKTEGLGVEQSEVLKNGKMTILALMGLCYRLVNKDVTEKEVKQEPSDWEDRMFVYGGFVSLYKKNDSDIKFKRLMKDIIKILSDSYKKAINNKSASSASNFMKRDSKYYKEILPDFIDAFDMMVGDDIKTCYDILKR